MKSFFETRWPALSVMPVLVCLLLSACQLSAQTPSPAPDKSVVLLMQSGAEAMHQGKAAEAEEYFQQAVAASPELPDAYLGLGMCELREGKSGAAEKTLAKAVELSPKAQGAHLFLGISQYQLHHLDAAVASLQQELAQQPENVEVLTWLGIVELGAGHPEQATGPLDRAAALNPKDPNVLDFRGRAHSLVAQDSYRALTALDADSWRVHRALGEVASESKQHEEAAAEYRKAIERQPNNPDLYEALGEEYQRLSRFADASSAYEAALKLNPQSPIALYNSGKIQVQNGDPRRGVSLLREAVAAHAIASPAYYYLGLGLAQTGQPEEAAVWLEKCLAEEPSPFLRQGAYFQLARIYKTLNRAEDALRAANELKKVKDAAAAFGPAAGELP